MAKNTNARKDEADNTITAEESIVTETTTATAESNSVTHVECAVEEESGAEASRKGVLSRVCGAVQKGIYTGVYGVTYGVVYSALVVGDLIPTNNVVGNGVRDGLAAAKKAYAERPVKAASDVADEAVAAPA